MEGEEPKLPAVRSIAWLDVRDFTVLRVSARARTHEQTANEHHHAWNDKESRIEQRIKSGAANFSFDFLPRVHLFAARHVLVVRDHYRTRGRMSDQRKPARRREAHQKKDKANLTHGWCLYI